MGRPRKKEALSAAERMKRFRDRRKKEGARDYLVRLSGDQVKSLEAQANKAGVSETQQILQIIGEAL